MPSTLLACPDEADLLALAMGEPVAAEVAAHVAECERCQAERDRLQAEVAMLRDNRPKAPLSSSTPSETRPYPAETSIQVDDFGTTASPTDRGQDDEGPTPEEPPMPAAIGRYLVIGRFPLTGQAEVFRVVHPGLRLELVLKLSLESVRPDGRCEIIEEGRILAQLAHPNLVRVYDSDFFDDRPYLVMEYIRGRTLDQLAREGRLKPRRAADLLAKVAGAAEHAHRQGIFHRDIKPKNILVAESGEPRLIDFGMARLCHAYADDPGLTGGTFAYMAPEQARVELPEEQAKVGPCSDVFALGAVLYHLLTGEAPFAGRNWRESMGRARRCDFDRKALDDPRIPRELRGICLKAMAADPADRYTSAEALQQALVRFMNRPKVRALAAGVVGSVLLGGLFYALIPPRQDLTQSQNQTIVIPHPTPAPVSLTGELTVRVWSPKGGGKRGLKVDEPGALPLLPGEQVHVEAQLNKPAYSYLLWLDGQGHASLLYPRDDGKFGSRPSSGGSARETVHSPEARDEGHSMQGAGGLETVLLMVRRTPLPTGMDLAGLIGPLPPSPFQDELEVAVRGFDEGQPLETLRVDIHRGIGEESKKIDDPLLQLMERLRSQNQFEVIKAVRFAYRGE